MKRKHIQVMICMAIFFILANQAWAAAQWVPYWATNEGDDCYYDKSSITKVNKNIVSVYSKQMLNNKQKNTWFEVLKKDKLHVPDTPNEFSYLVYLYEFDCLNGKYRDVGFNIYDTQGNTIYSSSKKYGWKVTPHVSANKALKNIVCNNGKTSGKCIFPREELQSFVNGMAEVLPLEDNPIIALTNISLISGNVILYKYSIDTKRLIKFMAESEGMSVREFQQNAISQYGSFDKYIKMRKTHMEDDVARGQCRTTIMRNYIDGGVIFKHAYYEKRGPLFLEVNIDKNRCSKF
jgi:hypothetical protein